MAMTQTNTSKLGAAALAACISAIWRQNIQVLGELLYHFTHPNQMVFTWETG